MRYVYNTIEEYVKKMYESIDIYLPRQLDMETITARLGMIIEFFPHDSMVIDQSIIIDIDCLHNNNGKISDMN